MLGWLQLVWTPLVQLCVLRARIYTEVLQPIES